MFCSTRSANARRRVKFRENRSNGCGDIAILRFSQMAAASIFDFQNFKFLTAGTFLIQNLPYSAKIHEDRSIRC